MFRNMFFFGFDSRLFCLICSNITVITRGDHWGGGTGDTSLVIGSADYFSSCSTTAGSWLEIEKRAGVADTHMSA